METSSGTQLEESQPIRKPVVLAQSPDSPVDAPGVVRIHDLPPDERPREKLLQRGAQSLSDGELLALFFGTGTRGLSAVDLGRALLTKFGSLGALCRREVKELMQQKGIGEAKAIHLAAALELGRRLAAERFRDEPLDSPEALAEYLGPQLRPLAKESLRVVLLNTRLNLLATEEIHLGSVNETMAHPREILRPVIAHGAYAFVVAHNHPSGDPTPSQADRSFTQRLKQAAEILQVRMLDHIIIGQPGPQNPHGYFSFRETGAI